MIESTYITGTEALYLLATGEKVTTDEAWEAAKANIVQWGVGDVPNILNNLEKLQNGWAEKSPKEIAALSKDDKFNYECELGGIKNTNRLCTENNLTYLQAIADLTKFYKEQQDLQAKLDKAELLILEYARAGKIKLYGEFVPDRSNNETDAISVAIPDDYLRIDCLGFNLLYNQLSPSGNTEDYLRYAGRGRYDNIKVLATDVQGLITAPAKLGEIKATTPPPQSLLLTDNRQKGRPTEQDIRDIAREVYRRYEDGKKPNISQSEKLIGELVRGRFAKSAHYKNRENPYRKILEEQEFQEQRTRQGRRSND